MVAATGRGTTAYQANAQSVRGLRQAGVQAGQQLQDVFISLEGGQRTSTVLAQQLPQLAFALSDVGGKAGAVARVLAGPAGLLLIPFGIVLGNWIDRLFGLGKEKDSVRGKTIDLIDAISKGKGRDRRSHQGDR